MVDDHGGHVGQILGAAGGAVEQGNEMFLGVVLE